MALRKLSQYFARNLRVASPASVRSMSGGEYGDGVGRGGGGGGSIRESGGAFGKMEAAREEQYFRKLQSEQMKKLKENMEDEISYHESEIREAEEEIARRKKKIHRLKEMAHEHSDTD